MNNEVHINEKLSEEDSGVDVVDENRVGNSNRRANIISFASFKILVQKNIVDLIKKPDVVFIGENEKLLFDNRPTDINAFAFLYKLQQPTKKIDTPNYFELLKVLQIKGGTNN